MHDAVRLRPDRWLHHARREDRASPLLERLAVRLFAEADVPSLACAKRRRAEVARRADCDLEELFVVVLAGSEGEHLLALSDHDLGRAFKQSCEVFGAEPLLAGVDRLTDGRSGLLEEGV